MTVTPDCINRITSNTTGTSTVTTTEETDIIDAGTTSGDDEGIDHKLPSPEEQLQVLALKYVHNNACMHLNVCYCFYFCTGSQLK